MDRDTLEQTALQTVSSDYYYDLADTIDSMTDEQLYQIVECDGDVKLEEKLQGVTV